MRYIAAGHLSVYGIIYAFLFIFAPTLEPATIPLIGFFAFLAFSLENLFSDLQRSKTIDTALRESVVQWTLPFFAGIVGGCFWGTFSALCGIIVECVAIGSPTAITAAIAFVPTMVSVSLSVETSVAFVDKICRRMLDLQSIERADQ